MMEIPISGDPWWKSLSLVIDDGNPYLFVRVEISISPEMAVLESELSELKRK